MSDASQAEDQFNEVRRSRARRRVVGRLAVAGAAAAAVAFGVVGVAQSAPSTPPTAGAETIQAARSEASAAILHVAVSATEIRGSGVVARWSDDAWIGYPFGLAGGFGVGNPPVGFRQILTHSGISAQTGVFGRELYSRIHHIQLPGDELYDRSRNTAYELKPVYYRPAVFKVGPPVGCRDAGSGGFYAGEAATLLGGTKRWDLRIQANELAGDVYLGGPSARPFFSGLQSVIPDLWSPCVSEQVANQVHSGMAKRVGTSSIDGHRAIEYRAIDGSWTYYADAHSGKPVRLAIRGIDGLELPQGQRPKRERDTLTLNVQAYDLLPFRGNEGLLSLPAQHPGARIDTKVADYYAAQARLFPRRRVG